MPKNVSKLETQIVLSADHDTGALDLRVFAAPSRSVEPEVVGTAALRMQDLRDVVAILRDELRLQNHIDAAQRAAKRTRKKKRA